MTPFFEQDYDYSKYNVLAVDDIPLNLLLVKKMLSRFNFEFRTAADGQQALDAVAAKKPDLILLDLMMLSSLTAIGVTLMTLYHSEPALEK